VSAGGDHTCGVQTAGTVACWEANQATVPATGRYPADRGRTPAVGARHRVSRGLLCHPGILGGGRAHPAAHRGGGRQPRLGRSAPPGAPAGEGRGHGRVDRDTPPRLLGCQAAPAQERSICGSPLSRHDEIKFSHNTDPVFSLLGRRTRRLRVWSSLGAAARSGAVTLGAAKHAGIAALPASARGGKPEGRRRWPAMRGTGREERAQPMAWMEAPQHDGLEDAKHHRGEARAPDTA
jgi:hypothetical protein